MIETIQSRGLLVPSSCRIVAVLGRGAPAPLRAIPLLCAAAATLATTIGYASERGMERPVSTSPKPATRSVGPKTAPTGTKSDPQIPRTVPAKVSSGEAPPTGSRDGTAEGSESATALTSGTLFPDWSPRAFDLSLGPVLGYRSTSNRTTHRTESTFEGGLFAGVTGIPVVPGNPGLHVSPSAGYAYGLHTLVDPETKTSDRASYHRAWTSVDFEVPVRFYRHTLGLTYGRIWGGKVARTQNVGIRNDFGVLVLPFFSTHYTHTFTRGFGARASDEFFRSHDNWLHGRVFTGFLSAHVDTGPGVTFATTRPPGDVLPEGGGEIETSVVYWLLKTGLHLFWKLGAEGEFRYVFSSETKPADTEVMLSRLPSEDLNAAPSLFLEPKDTLEGRFFFGLKDLFAGLGVGYTYAITVRNATGHGGKSPETHSESGFGISFTSRH